MVILLPERGGFEQFEDSLNADLVEAITENLSGRRVALKMPRFEFESDFSLASTLASMGMPDAFDKDRADFLDMAILWPGEIRLFISRVIHKAFVSVDEAGTEAAAATAVIMAVTTSVTVPPEPVEMTVDRPFIFLIRDIQTGTVLFVGRVVDPGM